MKIVETYPRFDRDLLPSAREDALRRFDTGAKAPENSKQAKALARISASTDGEHGVLLYWLGLVDDAIAVEVFRNDLAQYYRLPVRVCELPHAMAAHVLQLKTVSVVAAVMMPPSAKKPAVAKASKAAKKG